MNSAKPRPEDAPGTSQRALAERRVGEKVGDRWTLEALLGIGGSASVYAAKHGNGRRAAVKILHSDLRADPRVCRRFASEGYVSNKVGHPGAVVVLDDGQDADGTPFLVMELLLGRSLADMLRDGGPLSPVVVARVASKVLDVLAAAHDRGILHRDIKPSNVFLTSEGEVKVLDFGAARLREFEDFVTISGAVLGTPAFMAPELASGNVDAVDARSDLWALGATMFQLLTGTTVHQARSAQEAVVAAATRSAPPLKSRREDVPDVLADVVDRALRFESSERWPNARAMLAALDAVAPDAGAGQRSEGPTFDTVSEPALVRSRRRPSRARVAGSIFGGVLVVVAVVMAARHARLEAPAVRAIAPKQLVAPSRLPVPAASETPAPSTAAVAPPEPPEERTSAPPTAGSPSQKAKVRHGAARAPSTEQTPAADALLDRRK